MLRILFIITITVFMASCSAHPLPSDVSRETTFGIIHNIRCEARDAVKAAVQNLLRSSHSPIVRAIDPEDALEKINKIRRYDRKVGQLIDKYKSTAIGYSFIFEITENNNASQTSANFILPWSSSSFSLGLSGGVSKHRLGNRKVGVVETFEELDALNCSHASRPKKKLLYPITGSVGMAEIINSFLRLAESVGSNKKFSDTLTFTTEVSGNADPTVELKPVNDRFRLKDASGKFSVTRKDVHKMFVALTFPVTKQKRVGTKKFRPLARREFIGPLEFQKRKVEGELDEVTSETKRKAAEELCIQEALIQEQLLGRTRNRPPELYCRDDLRRY